MPNVNLKDSTEMLSYGAENEENQTAPQPRQPARPSSTPQSTPTEGEDNSVTNTETCDSLGENLRRRRCRSQVWEHFTKHIVAGKMKAVCNDCSRMLGGDSKNGTKHLHDHLKYCPMRSSKTERVPLVFKGMRKGRVRRTEDRLKALARDAEVFKMVRPRERSMQNARENVEATTSASIQTQPTLKGGVNGIGYPTNMVSPSTQQTTISVSLSTRQPTDFVLPSSERSTNFVPPTKQSTNLVPPNEQPNHVVYIESKPSDEELVDFQGLAMLPRRQAILLVRACIDHPDLAICPGKSKRWREYAYSTLGELLFFLTSTRVKEMAQKACEHLQTLWEEAQGLGFDLSWLAPVVESGLGSSSELVDIRPLEERKDGLKERKFTLQCQLTKLTKKLTKVEKKLAAVEVLKKRKNTLHCQLTTLTMQLIEVDKGISVWEDLFRSVKEEQDRFLFPDLRMCKDHIDRLLCLSNSK